MALIDHSIVERLIVARLNTALDGTGIVLLLRNDPEPTSDATADGGENIDKWARLMAIRQNPVRRQRDNAGIAGSEPDHAQIIVRVQVFASIAVQDQSAYAIDHVAATVAAALAEQTLTDGAHSIDLYQPEIVIDDDVDEQRRIATGAVIVAGRACRASGATLETHP